MGHTYESDVAEFTFGDLTYRRDAERSWLSCLYALLEGASEGLEISRDDIDGALSWSTGGLRSIVLFDTVPGGAGAAKRIAENIEGVLRSAIDRVRVCDCGPETSCYGCLRSYRNARVHDQLSRRGALQILDELGIDGMRSSVSADWATTLEVADDSVEQLLEQLAQHDLAKPIIGAEVGSEKWWVEAAWADQLVALVSGEDGERDNALARMGYRVLRADETSVDALVGALATSGTS